MQKAIVIRPKAELYTSFPNNCRPIEQEVCDELLSGWTVTILERRGNWLKILTDYGYSGWLNDCGLRCLNQQQCSRWADSPFDVLLIQRLTDVLASPKVQALRLTTLFMGSHVIACGTQEDGWQKIQLADATTGYVPAIAASSLPRLKVIPKEPAKQDALRSDILAYASSYLGAQYRWGGKTHEGIDCSGLSFMSYFMCGITIYRDAAIQSGYPVKEIPFSEIKPADLLYFPGHVALYIGNGQYIHCTGNVKSFGCMINSLHPDAPDYRADLAESLYAAGSVFV